MRKSRQMEIELGISRTESNKIRNEVASSEKLLVKMEGDGRRDSSDSEVVMSSTSYPGMEWQPREFSRWDGD